MQPAENRDDVLGVARALEKDGHQVSMAVLEGGKSRTAMELGGLFGGRPPDVVVADLRTSSDCLPLAHARRMLRSLWGDDAPMPLFIALFQPRHLDLPEWRAYVDDFLMPPHVPDEVVKRMSLLLFRQRNILPEKLIELSGISIQLDRGTVVDANDNIVALTPREFDLLRFLAEHRGRLFSRDQLLDLVWGVNFEGGARTVDIHVRRLRAKLPIHTASLLQTRRGLGYGFESPASTRAGT